MPVCTWCGRQLPTPSRADARTCSRKCRQAAWRLRRLADPDDGSGISLAACGAALRFAYADPPYPGRARKYYHAEEVDQAALIARLMAGGYAGWALSTAADALRAVLPLCPPQARVCAWVKPIAACSRTRGLHNTWEPLIVVVGRRRRPGKRDWLAAQPARFGGSLPGRKPLAFCAWLFGLLGMEPGDQLDDLFPGTGIVGRAWRELSSGAGAERHVVQTSRSDVVQTSRSDVVQTSRSDVV